MRKKGHAANTVAADPKGTGGKKKEKKGGVQVPRVHVLRTKRPGKKKKRKEKGIPTRIDSRTLFISPSFAL